MSVSNGIISKNSVHLASDVASLLEVNNNSVSYLCSNVHGKINKYSYHKPIKYAQVNGLSEEQFIGQSADLYKGVFCGIGMGTNYGRLGDLHNHTFEYYPPTGGAESPYREGDFRGYDKNATPTPTAEINNRISYGSENGLTASFYYDENNTTGVN